MTEAGRRALSGAGATAAIAAAAAAACAIGALLAVGGTSRWAAILLTIGQTLGVLWFGLRSWSSERAWATAGFVAAAGWVLIFLIPSWIFAIDPALFVPLANLDKTVAVVDLALFAMIAGYEGLLALRGRPGPGEGGLAQVDAGELSKTRAAIWVAVGVLAMAILFGVNGGPIHWLSNLDKAGKMAQGLTYLIWVALGIKFVAVTAVCNHWARGEPVGRRLVFWLAASLVVISLLGARAFIAITLTELVLFYALVRRPIRMRLMAPATLVIAVVLIFGLGTVKRYQGFHTKFPQVTFTQYVKNNAIHEVAAAYANNYADGVRLTGLARQLVPSQANYEYGTGILRLAVQPIPRPWRPKVHAQALIENTFFTLPNGYSYALPLHVVAYLQFGIAGVIAVSLALGAFIAFLELLLHRRRRSLPVMLALIATVVEVPFLMRTGLPRGLALSVLEIVGAYVVARTIMRPAPPSPAEPRTG